MAMTADFWVSVGKIILLDLILAGDNAIVIALAVRTLPPRQQLLGRLWGTAGAVGLRLLFIAVVTYLLGIPLLQVAGALLLLWIAIKLVRQTDGGDEAQGHVRQGSTLLEAIWIIVVADVVMSLDNVIAVAGAAHGDLRLVIFGIGLSIPIVIWTSGILSRLMNRYPWIVLLGAGVLGEVAGKMIVDDHWVVARFGDVSPAVEWALRLALFAAIVLVGWIWSRRRPVTTGHPATR
jgi:YjbE family integral membrane protein